MKSQRACRDRRRIRGRVVTGFATLVALALAVPALASGGIVAATAMHNIGLSYALAFPQCDTLLSTHTLHVRSKTPDSGVQILVNGSNVYLTPFDYSTSSTSVELCAPSSGPNYRFVKWQKDGVDISTNACITVTMDADHTMTAVFVYYRTLHVLASGSGGSVPIGVSPTDLDGKGSDTTSFDRVYALNTTVCLTAPATFNGNTFVKWQKDGADFSTSLTACLPMDADHTMTAVYACLHTLHVDTSPPNLFLYILVTPDYYGHGDAYTPFTHVYLCGTPVSLTAPSSIPGYRFVKWQKDGVDSCTTITCTVTMDADHTMVAVYVAIDNLHVRSTTPDSGVLIQVSPNDNSNHGSDYTPFDRVYDHNTSVTLCAPSSGPNYRFVEWLRDGAHYASTPCVTVTIDTDHTMTAVFVYYRTLHVLASGSGGSVLITVTPNDLDGKGSDTTSFDRVYALNTQVSLTAPCSAPNGNIFDRWLETGETSQPVTVTMSADATRTAVYVAPAILHVRSSNPDSGVSIAFTPADACGTASGTTPFDLRYRSGTPATLTAPASASSNVFVKWLETGETSRTISVNMAADVTRTAVYAAVHTLHVLSAGVSSGVNAGVSPNDNNGQGGGTTSFDRLYNHGTWVTLVADATTTGGYPFVKWLKDGADISPNMTANVTMDADHTMTAVYATTATVRGHVDMDRYSGGPGIGTNLDSRDPGTPIVRYTAYIVLDAASNYSAPNVPIGKYDVTVKFPNWLRQVIPNVTLTYPETVVNFSQLNGDAHPDNKVDLVDLSMVLANFMSQGTPPTDGDLNWDGTVNLLDLSVVLSNFGQPGDP